MSEVDVIDQIEVAFHERGSGRYGAEAVTQLEHALQSAQLAVQGNEPDSLVTAALLHDLGHLLHEETLREGCEVNLDDSHESIGHDFLVAHFGAAVADPVRLHVVAKRYLCTIKPDYEQKLSPTSRKSYHDQGGKMSEQEQKDFEAEPHFKASLRLRHWDDTAKNPDAVTPPLENFLPYVRRALGSFKNGE